MHKTTIVNHSNVYKNSQTVILSISIKYLVKTPAHRVLLAGSELLQLGIQDVHELLHQSHGGAHIAGEDGSFGVLRQLIGQIRRVLSTPNLQ